MNPYRLETGLIFVVAVLTVYLLLYRPLIFFLNRRKPRIKKRFLHVMTGLAGLILLFALIQMALALWIQHQINNLAGFRYATPETKKGEYFVVKETDPAKFLHNAGLRPGDTLAFSRVDALYQLLIEQQGKRAFLPVKRGNRTDTLIADVPAMRIRHRKLCLFYQLKALNAP